MAMPARYVAREASWQCIGEWGSLPVYRLMGSETMLCTLKRCDPGTVTVCGLRFDVNVEIPVDEIVKLSVTPDHFASTEITPPGIHVQCKIEGGVRRYATTDDPKKLCGKFACLPAKLSACDSTVFVDRAADPGMVVEARTKDRRSVIVQCLEEEGRAPHYVAVDCTGGSKPR
ncbi:MAG: hypothetical protein PHE27_02670 [Alphaproteobacteria bacterium]|nr:hypothetical protein [Alphaproteobacteria bacterium]